MLMGWMPSRYPTFEQAIEDLDDALSTVVLFAALPTLPGPGVDVEHCQRLMTEFQHWVIEKGALRYVFLSIKGIYYQVNIGAKKVTWVTPYAFAQEVREVEWAGVERKD